MIQKKVIYQELESNGYTLRGLFTVPSNQEFDNIVVMFHGYTGHKNENGYLFKQITDCILPLGLASLRFDFMGSGDSDGEFSDMTFLTEIEDAKRIIEYAYELNHGRPIILLGFSMGGAVASRVSLLYKDKIEKLILLSPAGCMDKSAQTTFSTHPVDENGNVDLGGYYLNQKFLHSFDDLNLYQDIETFFAPVLLIHGEEDLAVPIAYGEKYHTLYPNNTFYRIAGSPHCYTKVPYRKLVQTYIINFLKENK